jgi:serine protease Do
MLKKLLVGAGLCAVALFCCGGHQSDVGAYLLKEKAPQVMKLTPVSRHNTGGTGFSLRAPSGKVYTITNGHVCGLAENGLMSAQSVGTNRWVTIKVIEVAPLTDLCVLEGLPAASGLELASSIDMHAEFFVVGHPKLEPITVSPGYIRSREIIDVIMGPAGDGCSGPGYRTESVPGFFGEPMPVCIRSIDGYDTSAVIYPGNSGSPCFTADGDVMGVVFAGAGDTNYGSAIPLDVLRSFIGAY